MIDFNKKYGEGSITEKEGVYTIHGDNSNYLKEIDSDYHIERYFALVDDFSIPSGIHVLGHEFLSKLTHTPKNLSIPDSVIEIGNNVMTSITQIPGDFHLPKNLIKIGFGFLSALESVPEY